MGNLGDLFTSTQGRIGRQQWWIGTVILIIINFAVSLLIFPMIGFGMPNFAALVADATADPAAVQATVAAAIQKSSWASLILFVILAYPLYAIGIKRRHDKDNNGLDLIIYLGVTAVFLLCQALGIAPIVVTVLSFVFLIFAIYMLVVMGFLRGTPGPNQYGPDPLGGA